MAPDAGGTMRKIPQDSLTEPGFALARVGDGGWWPAVQRGLSGGTFESEVIAGLADALGSGPAQVRWVTAIPSRRLGALMDKLAVRLAEELGVQKVDLVRRVRDSPPQREMANAVQQAANVRGAFEILAAPPAGTGVLLDDRRGSGWTLAMVGGQLRRAGAERVIPLVLATVL